MYKRKLTIFATLALCMMILIAGSVVVSAKYTRSNLAQTTIAQSLLNEHLRISSISYRLFKQLTDELIFGKDANQAEVRKKRVIIAQSIEKIVELEKKQRESLGEEATQGSIEDTNELVQLLDRIINEFNAIIDEADTKRLAQRERVQKLLEVTIDKRFREAINTAVTRQGNVVASLTARTEAMNESIIWYSILIAGLAIPLIVFGVYWLLAILYNPLNSIRLGAEAIAQGKYSYRISRGFDAEFDAIAASFNSMAEELLKQQTAVERSTKELEFEVSQRTSELTEANQLLQANDKARREFLADISHELRTPLSIIRGEIQVTLRQRSNNEDDYKFALETVLDQSLGLSRLVDDLLLIARAESGRLRILPKTVDLDLFLKQMKKQFDNMLERKNAKLTINIESNSVPVEIDPDRISQVLMIIVDNALNYAGESPEVSIDCNIKGEHLEFIIGDNGDGIEEEVLPYIFNRYFRGADSRTGQGAGLGLAIAKAIVTGHGGSIEVQSKLSMGTKFIVSIPQGNQVHLINNV